MLLADPSRLAHEAIAAAFRPSPPIDYLRFATENIVFGPGEPRPGPYDRRAFGYFDEVLRALGPNDSCRIGPLQASAQIGKTILGNIFALGSVVMGRGTTMIVHPGLEGAARWSRMKLTPMMRSIASVALLFPQRPRDAADAILYKERVDGLGSLLISGANSAASLSQVTAPFVLEDDLSKFEANSGGDPEAQADSRARAHEFGKIFKMSTPLTLPDCRITRDFMAGSQERPHVPCPHCQHMHVLEWANFHFEQPDSPFFNCPACGSVIEEKHRSAMLAGFQWVASNPGAARTHRSFWLWSAYSVLQSWPRIAAEFSRAQGDSGAEQTFWTDTLGLAYQPKGDARPPHELAARASRSHYGRGEVPEGALILTCGVDVQLDRVEWQVIGHGEGFRKFVIDVGVIGKHISEPDCQRNLDLLLQRRWTNCRGRPLEISMTAIDAGFSTDDVLAYCQRHSPDKVIAVRGVGGDATPRIMRVQRERSEKTGTVLKYSKRFYNIGIYAFKSSLYRDLLKDDPKEKGYIAFPRDLPLSYYEELVSERRVAHKRMGQLVYTWEKPTRQANEAHDTFLYASAAGIKYGVNFISDQGWAERRAALESASPPPPRERRSLASQLAKW
jgi:phage terminase large subunit GpA-like protein